MDEHGYFASTLTALRTFEHASRNTGRTMRLIERVCDGDVIICADYPVAEWVRNRLKKAGKPKVQVRVSSPTDPSRIFDQGAPAAGRTFFDHTWVLQFLERGLEHAREQVEFLQRESSTTWPGAPPPAEPEPRFRG